MEDRRKKEIYKTKIPANWQWGIMREKDKRKEKKEERKR